MSYNPASSAECDRLIAMFETNLKKVLSDREKWREEWATAMANASWFRKLFGFAKKNQANIEAQFADVIKKLDYAINDVKRMRSIWLHAESMDLS